MTFININSVTIHYKWINNKKDKTFLFINSLGTDFRIWDEVVGLLKEYGNILLFDKRGHGLSDIVTGAIGLNYFADDAEDLLNHLQINKCIIIGLSVGGMITQILANRIPDRIEKLVLCDTGHKIGNEQVWNTRIQQVKENGLGEISDGVMQRWFSDKFRNEQSANVAGFKNMLERTLALGYIQTCEAIRDADLAEIAKQIKIPALCVVGSEDKSTLPEEVKNLADLIEGSRYEVIEGSGHIPCVDNPEAFTKLIIDFIK
ncbi:MAG: 3-oxoadipate enol-lactonase [Ferruginibacter sp.]